MNDRHITKTEMQQLKAQLAIYYNRYTETKAQADAIMNMIKIIDKRILGL